MQALNNMVSMVRGNGYLMFWGGFIAAVAYGLCKLAALLPTL